MTMTSQKTLFAVRHSRLSALTFIRANRENNFGRSVYFFKWDVLVSRGRQTLKLL